MPASRSLTGHGSDRVRLVMAAGRRVSRKTRPIKGRSEPDQRGFAVLERHVGEGAAVADRGSQLGDPHEARVDLLLRREEVRDVAQSCFAVMVS